MGTAILETVGTAVTATLAVLDTMPAADLQADVLKRDSTHLRFQLGERPGCAALSIDARPLLRATRQHIRDSESERSDTDGYANYRRQDPRDPYSSEHRQTRGR